MPFSRLGERIMYKITVAVVMKDMSWKEEEITCSPSDIKLEEWYPSSGKIIDKLSYRALEICRLNRLGGDDTLGYAVLSVEMLN